MENKIILLIEDDEDDVILMRRALKKSHIANEIIWAKDGIEALDYLFGTGAYASRDTSVLPAVALLDLHLPKMDGVEVLRRIRADKRTALLPVVILTASLEEADKLNGYSAGANSYVRKPVNFDQFVSAVAQLGLYWLIMNEAP